MEMILNILCQEKCQKKSVAIFIVQLALSPLCLIPFIGLMFGAAYVIMEVFVLIAIIKGCQGEDFKIPGIYDLGNLIWGKK